jgi:hypothetical protein
VDRGMLDNAYAAVGAGRLLWGADITLCTGLAKLWALEVIGLTSDEMADVKWRNARRIFASLDREPGTGNREANSTQRSAPIPDSPVPIPDR